MIPRSSFTHFFVLAFCTLAVSAYAELEFPEPKFDMSSSSPGGTEERQESIDSSLFGDNLAFLWSVDLGLSSIVFTPAATLAQAAGSDASKPSSAVPGTVSSRLLNNGYYSESLRYKSLSVSAFDYGDYDAAVVYATESLRYATLSDDYIAAQMREYRLQQENAQREARLLKERLEREAQLQREKELKEAQLQRDKAQLEDRLRKEAEDRIKNMKRADEMIGEAKNRLDWAASVGAEQTYRQQYNDAKVAYGEAVSARGAESWDNAYSLAQKVLALLKDVKDTAPLPARYTVRPWAETKDCFWNIAGYPFVYGDPTKWTLLYEANKTKLRRPDNPNLIHPGLVLDIPSLRGESREGLWVKGRAYAPLPAKK